MKTLYQTLEDRDNIEAVERDGPYLCRNKTAWLGIGYYFWDTFFFYAQWWGDKVYKKNGYIICKSVVDMSHLDVLDLNEPEVLEDIREIRDELKKNKESDEEVTVSQAIEFLKRNTDFKYKMIKARVDFAVKESEMPFHKMKFKAGNIAYLDTMPQVQVCILDKTVIGKDNFHVVYPPEYVSGYAI